MPEAAINEDDDPLRAKNKIRVPAHLDVPSPSDNAGCAKRANQPTFGRSIAPLADSRHEG
jgi:hypothetical protein